MAHTTDTPTPLTSVAFTEGPAAAADGTVYFTDIANNRILTWKPSAPAYSVWREPSGRANGLLFDPQEHLLLCEGNEFGPNDGNRRVTRCDRSGENFTVLCDSFDGRRLNSPNDIACTSEGHIFFTDPCYGDRSTMDLDHDSVFHIDPDGSVEIAVSQPDIQRPNGIHISPDERTLYLVDSCPVPDGNRKIWAFDLDARGTLSNQRVIYDFGRGRGGDGMTVDSEGTLYIAAGIHRPRGPHETTDVAPGIYQITPQGEFRRRIPIEEDVLTNVTFGGNDMRTLFITAGKTLFTCRTQVAGFAVHRRPE